MQLSSLDLLIASRSLLQHPFYQRWSKGELTLEDLKVYAKEYYYLVQRIPGMVASVAERAADNPALAWQMQKNESEELEHVGLWERFASSLGISADELRSHQPSKTVHDAVSELEQLCAGSLDEGVSAMYALECELPKIAQSKKDGLEAFYGLTSQDAHIYFDEHLDEEKHLQVWRSMEVDGITATKAAERSVAAQNKLLDGVCDACGISVYC